MRRLIVALVAVACAPLPARAEAAPEPLRTSGYIQASYAFSNHRVDGRIPGNVYLPAHNEFLLQGAMLKLERPLSAKEPGAGFVIEAMAGREAEVIRAAGLDLGSHADLPQAYVTLGLPAAGLTFCAGKLATMLGNEVIESTLNGSLSVGSQYVFIENFTDTGIDAAWSGANGWSARARVVNGWDVVSDNNRQKTVFGKLGWSKAAHSIAVLGYTGRELPDSVGGQRSGAELLATTSIGRMSATLQLDAGREEALDATWSAVGLWLRAPISGRVELALRGDLLDDADGARTSGALGFPAFGSQRLASGTATLLIRPVPGCLIRPELRYDCSDRGVFDGATDQWNGALGVAYVF